MSSFAVTVERLTIHPHENADSLELAQVGLYRAVVLKGRYRTGDLAFYIPEQAILPEALIVELGLEGRLAGKAKDRVRAVRLRGELSQGIVCRPSALDDVDLEAALASREDFADRLGITKWVPDIPTHMSGAVEPAPELLQWVDIESLQRFPDIFVEGEQVVATEKIHGTCCLTTVDVATGQTWVSSKGWGASRLALMESDRNVYWRAVRGHDLPSAAMRIGKALGAEKVGIFSEVYGQGVQDLGYGHDTRRGVPGLAVFDIAAVIDGVHTWLPADEVSALCAQEGLLMPAVLYRGPFDVAALMAAANGREQVSGTEAHIREGVVIRPLVERYSPVTGDRAIAKLVSGDYATRKGGTEYQ